MQGSQQAVVTAPITHSPIFRIAILVVALFIRLVSVADCPSGTIPFSSPHRSMIVVPVRVNGSGPYSFLLDTGATSSAIDPKLSNSLHLATGESVRFSSWEYTTDTRRVVVQSLSFGPIDSGPLSVLVQPLSELKAIDTHVRGLLGQDVLLHSNFLIDNRRHLIRFDDDGVLLAGLTGDRISVTPVRTRAGALVSPLVAVPVQAAGNAQPLYLLLDSGADMVVFQPFVKPIPSIPGGTRWIADENGKRSPATSFHTRLSIGSETFSTEAWIGDPALKFLAIDGLLATGSFDQLYIDNRDSFVIFDPGYAPHPPASASEAMGGTTPQP